VKSASLKYFIFSSPFVRISEEKFFCFYEAQSLKNFGLFARRLYKTRPGSLDIAATFSDVHIYLAGPMQANP
jgi:hypothetical protein